MSVIGTILLGLVIGVVARLLMPGRDKGGFIITAALGVAGCFVATYLGQAAGWYQAGEPAGFLGGVVGAILLLALFRVIGGRTKA